MRRSPDGKAECVVLIPNQLIAQPDKFTASKKFLTQQLGTGIAVSLRKGKKGEPMKYETNDIQRTDMTEAILKVEKKVPEKPTAADLREIAPLTTKVREKVRIAGYVNGDEINFRVLLPERSDAELLESIILDSLQSAKIQGIKGVSIWKERLASPTSKDATVSVRVKALGISSEIWKRAQELIGEKIADAGLKLKSAGKGEPKAEATSKSA